jgi:Ca-activated chloride channel family protein
MSRYSGLVRAARNSGVVAVAFLTVACSGATPTLAPGNPQQQWPTYAPIPAPTTAPWFGPTAASTSAPNAQGFNPFVDPSVDRYSTFGMDVDTASYGLARRTIQAGTMPDPNDVRTEEFVNSFDYGYQPPTDSAFAIHLDGGHTPFVGSDSILLRIGIKARDVSASQRPPVSLTFVIDTSGSMADENKEDNVKNALGLLVTRLRADDSVAIVSFNTDAQVILNPTPASDATAILNAISQLSPGGSTNAQEGLQLGYQLAAQGHRPGATDRVVLASDGVANVGATDAVSLLASVDDGVSTGVDLVAIGVGQSEYNDALLEQLADHGNGFYAYVNDRADAEQVFGDRLTGALETVANDAKVQVEFRPEAVVRYRLLGYEDRAIADQNFNNPAGDAGEVGAGHAVTALYEVQPTWGTDGFLGTVHLRWTDPVTGAEGSTAEDINLDQYGGDFFNSGPSFRLAAIVAAFAERLRHSPYAASFTLADVAREAGAIAQQFPDNQDVQILLDLTQKAAALEGSGGGTGW